MKLEDLQHIFKEQLEQQSDISLFYMIEEKQYKAVLRHPVDDLVGLLPMLDNFAFTSHHGKIPRFTKL